VASACRVGGAMGVLLVSGLTLAWRHRQAGSGPTPSSPAAPPVP
jgi:uncharacterized iron-regulated membrane protein